MVASDASAAGERRGRILTIGIAAFAVVALVVLVTMQRGAAPAAVEQPATVAAAGTAPPDISNMTPRERAERLYDRAMLAKEQGKADSASFFATMGTMVYQQLPDRTLDDRYDVGRLALITGALALARAEADSILAERPTHLLGLMLAEDASRAAGDAAAATAAHAKLLAAAAAERALALPEYASHQSEITAALSKAGATRP